MLPSGLLTPSGPGSKRNYPRGRGGSPRSSVDEREPLHASHARRYFCVFRCIVQVVGIYISCGVHQKPLILFRFPLFSNSALGTRWASGFDPFLPPRERPPSGDPFPGCHEPSSSPQILDSALFFLCVPHRVPRKAVRTEPFFASVPRFPPLSCCFFLFELKNKLGLF